MASRFSLNEFGRAFASRESGRELRKDVIARAADARAVVLDFADVTNVTYSFADEFAGRLVAEHPFEVRCENMAPAVAGPVERAIERRAGSALAC